MTNEEAIEHIENAMSILKARHMLKELDDKVSFVEREEYKKQFKSLQMAISALESIDRITAERDAAISDLKYLPSTTCKYANTDYCTKDCLCDKYEWRGIQNETN